MSTMQWPQNWSSGLTQTSMPSLGAQNPIGSAIRTQQSSNSWGLNSSASNPTGIGHFGSQIGQPMNIHGFKAAGAQGSGSGSGFGLNQGTGQLVLGGLQLLGNLWGAFQANKIAKQQLAFAREQFAFQKEFAPQNMANQIQSYNTTHEDRSHSRAHTQNQDPSTAETYIEKHRLPEKR